MEIKLVMDRERAIVLYRALEIIARVGMFQFQDMIDLICPDLDREKTRELETHMKGELSNLKGANYNSITHTPEECKVAWDAYQHLRREVAWSDVGKDWRKDQRKWNGDDSMFTVNFDEPMKTSSLSGNFKVERID